MNNGLLVRILVYVDDLLLTSHCEDSLKTVAEVLRVKYDAVTSRLWAEHDYLVIHWDFSKTGQASLVMEGYKNGFIL